jgi:transposase
MWYNIGTMYMRTVVSKGKKYAQLCHNYRDPQKGYSKTQVLFNFGRVEQLDIDALRRLVQSISRYFDPEEAERIRQEAGIGLGFRYEGSRHLGGSWLLDGVWNKIGVKRTLEKMLKSREYASPVERLLFAMVANRALAPSSKLAMEDWVSKEVFIEGLREVHVQQLYCAMDFLLQAQEEIQCRVYNSVINLFNTPLDLIFLDTTTTYFEIQGQDEEGELRRWGHSKDTRPDLAQAVIGFAMTRDGIPVKCWVWPGNTSEQSVISEVKRDLNGWKLGRVIMVMDTGFNSLENRRILLGAGDHYIIGERMRLGRDGRPHPALGRPGKFRKLENGLEIKEVVVGGDSVARQRFIVMFNPQEAEHDKETREDILRDVVSRLEALKQMEGEPHKKAACALRSHPVYGKYIRQGKGGTLHINRARVKAEEKLNGKSLISTSDDGLPAEDAALGYRHLWKIERLNRDLKHVVDVRPVYHRLEDRIRAHVLLCWLALLLIRIAENETGKTWHEIKKAILGLEVGIHTTSSGEVWQTTPVTRAQKEVFGRLGIKTPPTYLHIQTRSIRG